MAKLSDEKIDEIRSSVNIVHYISQFINLKKTGKNYKGLCPFHTEKTPSFVVSPEKQIYHCFGCGKGGNIYTFIMDYEKLSFMEAVKKAADFAGILLPKPESNPEQAGYFDRLYAMNETACQFFEQSLQQEKNQNWLRYLLDRQLSPTTIQKFRLGYAPDSDNGLQQALQEKNFSLEEVSNLGLLQKRDQGTGYFSKFRHRVIFPFHTVGGKIVGFGGRKLRETQQPKYLNSPESPIYKKGEILYGLHQAITSIREKGFVVLVEGYFDLLRLVENQFKNVVASSGTALTDIQARLIRRYTKDVYICYDGDAAGISAAIRNAQILEKQDLNVFIAALPAGEDPDTFVLKHGIQDFEAILSRKQSPMEFRIHAFLETTPGAAIEVNNQFIQNILGDLAELKNQVKIGLYLHQLSEQFQINETLLVEQLNHLKRYKQRYQDTAKEQHPSNPGFVRTGMHKAEAGITSLLLSGNQAIIDYIREEVSHELFENPPYIRIYEFTMQDLEETGQIDAQRLLEHFQDDEEITQLISEIMLLEYGDAKKFATDCIFQLKKWHLEKQSREISELIRKEKNSPESVLHYNQELIRIRKKIHALEKSRHDL